MRPIRTTLLRDRIDRYAPKAVIMFGWSYAEDWRALVDVPLEARSEPAPGILLGRRGGTTCMVCHHPTSFGITNGYFDQIGTILGKHATLTGAVERWWINGRYPSRRPPHFRVAFRFRVRPSVRITIEGAVRLGGPLPPATNASQEAGT